VNDKLEEKERIFIKNLDGSYWPTSCHDHKSNNQNCSLDRPLTYALDMTTDRSTT
jgi:hypothetical protein